MDSNNFADAAGVGEREGRIYAPLVAERSYGLAHGMGRSGNLIGAQPKAAGSSLLVKLANVFATQLIQGTCKRARSIGNLRGAHMFCSGRPWRLEGGRGGARGDGHGALFVHGGPKARTASGHVRCVVSLRSEQRHQSSGTGGTAVGCRRGQSGWVRAACGHAGVRVSCLV